MGDETGEVRAVDAAADEIGPVRIEALPEPRPRVGALILVSAVRPRD